MMMMRGPPPKKPGPDPPSFPGIKCSEHNVPRLGWRSTGLLEWVCMCNVPSYTILSLKHTPYKLLRYTRGALHAACCRSSLKEIADSIYMCLEERLGVQNDLASLN